MVKYGHKEGMRQTGCAPPQALVAHHALDVPAMSLTVNVVHV